VQRGRCAREAAGATLGDDVTKTRRAGFPVWWSGVGPRLGRLAALVALACVVLPATLAGAENCPSGGGEPCDARYRPVCARWDTGVRCVQAPCPSSESRLYTNACLACRDERVLGFEAGECAERPEPEVGRRYRVMLEPLVRHFDGEKRRNAVADVDLEVSEPISVLRAWIRLEGDAFSGSAEGTDPDEGVMEIPVEVQIAVEDAFDDGAASAARPVARLGPFEGFFKAEARLAPLADRYSGNPWAAFTDGKARVQLSLSGSCPGSCRYRERAGVDVRDAELVIDVLAESDLQGEH